jgi:hypothetical protein
MRLLQETSSPKGMDTGHQPHYPAAVELSHPQRCRKHPQALAARYHVVRRRNEAPKRSDDVPFGQSDCKCALSRAYADHVRG